MLRLLCLAVIVSPAVVCSRCCPAAEPTVFRGGRILTAASQQFDPGVLVVADGKIQAVGPQDRVPIPPTARIVDVSGKVLIPGLVDTHSHLGVYSRPAVSSNRDGNERSGPVQTIVRALDSINPYDPGIRMANAGGVTSANIMPGSANVIGGQTIYVKLRGHTPEQMWIFDPHSIGGLKMANGENPKRVYGSKGKAPSTRMKVAALQRSEFVKAQDYKRQWDRYRQLTAAGEQPEQPKRDLNLEPLVEVLSGKRTVHFHTHRADDILSVLRLKQEFGFDLLIQHGTESYKVAQEVAAAGVSVSLTIVDSPGGKQEVVDFIEGCAAELARAGVKVLINTDDPVTDSRFLLRTAAIAVRGGLSQELALKSITIHPAEVMRLDHRIGSLAAGKDADFAILSGPPFSIYTQVLATYIEGEKVFDRSDSRLARYQTGGFASPRDELVPAPAAIQKPVPLPPVRQNPQQAKPKEAADAADSHLIRVDRLYTVTGGTIDHAAVLIRNGKVAAVGKAGELAVPAGVPVLSARAATPGLIDAFSAVPLAGAYNIPADQDGDEKSDPSQADLRVLDGFHPGEPLLDYLLSRGVTTVHACPGRRNAIAGQTGIFHTHGRSAEEMALVFPHAMLFNLGVAPKTSYEERRPLTRMGTAALIRQALVEAADYSRRQKQRDEEADGKPFQRSLAKQALADVLEKKIAPLFAAQQADDILTAMRIAKEFSLEPQLALAAEGYLLADELKATRIPVIVHPTMQRVGSLETFQTVLGNAAALADRGVLLAIGSGIESYVPKTRVVRFEAGMAMVHGLGFDRALAAVTIDAARILGIADEYGSIENGKVADLVLYDGDPFEHTTHVTHVMIRGRLVFDRARRRKIWGDDWQRLSLPRVPCCLDL